MCEEGPGSPLFTEAVACGGEFLVDPVNYPSPADPISRSTSERTSRGVIGFTK